MTGAGRPASLVLVAVSPRLPRLFAARAWRALEDAHASGRAVHVAGAAHPSLPALDAAGIGWSAGAPDMTTAMVTFLLDPGEDAAPRTVEVLAAEHSFDIVLVPAGEEPKGSRMLDLAAVESRLRGPGGCPWDHKQTHASLARHLVEEAYETLDAIEEGSAGHLVEELGDVLLQVVFHAQIAEDAGDFDIDDVACTVVDKLVRRHPHVFGDVQVSTADEVVVNWDTIKREEEGRTDPLEGIPRGLPALQLAAKLQKRAAGEGFTWPPEGAADAALVADLAAVLARQDTAGAVQARRPASGTGALGERDVGDLLFALVALARAAGVEPESALRASARRFREHFAAARSAVIADGHAPRDLDAAMRWDYWRDAGQETRAGG